MYVCVYEYVHGIKRVCCGGNVLFTFPLLMFLRNCFFSVLRDKQKREREREAWEIFEGGIQISHPCLMCVVI